METPLHEAPQGGWGGRGRGHVLRGQGHGTGQVKSVRCREGEIRGCFVQEDTSKELNDLKVLSFVSTTVEMT